MPILMAQIGGQSVDALVDSGCTQSLVTVAVGQAHGGGGPILALDGGEVQSLGEVELDVVVLGVTRKVLFRVVD